MDFAAVGQLAKQKLFGQRLLDLVLQQTPHRTRPVQFVITLFRQPIARIAVKLDVYVLFSQLQFELQDELVDHACNGGFAQIGKGHNRIEPVAEFRREHLLDRFFASIFLGHIAKANALAGHVGCTSIGGHNQHNIAEIDRFAVVIGQSAIIHHLQQDVEQIGMRFLNFVEQQYAMRVLINRIG